MICMHNCDYPNQTLLHIVNDSLIGGIKELHLLSDDAVVWLHDRVKKSRKKAITPPQTDSLYKPLYNAHYHVLIINISYHSASGPPSTGPKTIVDCSQTSIFIVHIILKEIINISYHSF